ncbi:MAG: hypothetical protein MR598_04485 [Erysipelotrichaceae bacterium]|nr:hypothetical protein [Erysipelotrichaceae bacterium]
MSKSKIYHIFLFLSTFTRGLVEVFSLVLLYQKGFSVANIFFFLFIMYVVGILVNYISLKISYRIVLIVSSILFGISFFYLSFMNMTIFSLVLLAVLLACSNYSYHAIRHLLALELLEDREQSTRGIVFITYLAVIVSSLVGIYLIDKLSFIVTSFIIFILSFLALIPVLKLNHYDFHHSIGSLTSVKIEKDKVIFSILEQFKVIFLEVQPLFLYLYVDQSIYYVSIFNVIANLASLIVVYFLAKRIRKKYFKYICFLLGGVFLLKLNIKSGIILLGLAFLEGIFIKVYENVSLGNLYSLGNNSIQEYLIVEELIFFISKSIMMGIVCLFHINIYIVMYIGIVGVILSGFFIRE